MTKKCQQVDYISLVVSLYEVIRYQYSQVNVGFTENSFDPFGIKVNLIRDILIEKETEMNQISIEIKA